MQEFTEFHHWRPHPWHGLDVGPEPPGLVHAYIEICAFDLIRYEIDKRTRCRMINRPMADDADRYGSDFSLQP